MSKSFIMLAAVFIGACTAPGYESSAIKCTDERPQACTMEYRPVCGIQTGGARHTYSNRCSACADQHVMAYETGGCN